MIPPDANAEFVARMEDEEHAKLLLVDARPVSADPMAPETLSVIGGKDPERPPLVFQTFHGRVESSQLLVRIAELGVVALDEGDILLAPGGAHNRQDDEAWALQLLIQDGVLVHPGYLYDFSADDGTLLVVSLLTPPQDLRRGIQCIVERATT